MTIQDENGNRQGTAVKITNDTWLVILQYVIPRAVNGVAYIDILAGDGTGSKGLALTPVTYVADPPSLPIVFEDGSVRTIQPRKSNEFPGAWIVPGWTGSLIAQHVTATFLARI